MICFDVSHSPAPCAKAERKWCAPRAYPNNLRYYCNLLTCGMRTPPPLPSLSFPLLLLLPLVLLVLLLSEPVNSLQPTLCEPIDGDCPSDCLGSGYSGTLDFTALFHVSPFYPSTMRSAWKAEHDLKQFGDVSKFDRPATGLHMSLLYFCCYTPEEKASILSALHDLEWSPFDVSLDSFACNLDHDKSTIYLHGLPSSQSDLFSFARQAESFLLGRGLRVAPRQTLFHMTLARVGYDYRVDDAVNYFLDERITFGDVRIDGFTIDGERFRPTTTEMKAGDSFSLEQHRPSV